MSDLKYEQKLEQLNDTLKKWKEETENDNNENKARIIADLEKEISWLKKQLKLN